ncbi:sulfite exporter TauE/SafE family protein [Occallatibacter savannae]|uniref:sulfite exporter TauE/SafE family protein n=1 Tax=Occallatibacter savannae TaxID=1002691 RepID=UPI0013A53DA7|nr:sulfite exporter TauE/SafE family protein [Occallatibacter savannae]
MQYVVGFLIACAVGLTGVGAGSITAPILILFFHLKPAVAVGTALTFAAVIKFAVLPIYIRRRQVDRRILLLLCAGGIPGVVVGIQILKRMSVEDHEKGIFLVLGITIIFLSLVNLYRSLRSKFKAGTIDRSKWLPPIAALIGAEVGVSSAGAGALGAVVIMTLTQLSPALVVGTDMVFGLTVSTIGSGLHVFIGHYDLQVLGRLCAGGVVGAICGALLSSRLPSRALQMVLFICLIGLGVQLCVKAMS